MSAGVIPIMAVAAKLIEHLEDKEYEQREGDYDCSPTNLSNDGQQHNNISSTTYAPVGPFCSC